MTRTRLLALPLGALLLALASHTLTASAVPLAISHQGRLMDTLGTPLDGDHQLTVAIYDDAAPGTQLWTETHATVSFDGGYCHICVSNPYGNGAERTLITQPGAPGTTCGTYATSSSTTRPTVSFAFRNR